MKAFTTSQRFKTNKNLRRHNSCIIGLQFPRNGLLVGFMFSFICQGTSTRRQRRDLFGLRFKLPHVTTSLTTQR